MTLLAFLIGLAAGLGFWLWQQRRLHRHLGQMLGVLQTDTSDHSLPIIPRLRREITRAHQSRKALEEDLRMGQRLLAVAPIGYLQVDEENRLLLCNEQARELLQIDRWEPGQLRLLLELVRSYELDQLIQQTRREQNPDCREWSFHPPCLDGAAMGDVRSLTLRAASWPLAQGQVGVFLENQQPLVDLSQARNQWFSDLAHELRTPLTSIRLVAEALQGRVEPPASRWVEQLLHETNRLINLVQDWLELSHLEKNPSKNLTYQSVDLPSLIQSAWQTLEPLAQQKQLHLTYSGPDSIELKADAGRLKQVFLNLFDNSIKHSPSQTAIRVNVERVEPVNVAQASIQIDIVDSGTGFGESDLPHVFERLYRGDTSRHHKQASSKPSEALRGRNGSGLGLAIVQQIVQAHGGSIQARNHPETQGAWLQIKLPEN